MAKTGSRKIGNRWFTEEELLAAGRELADAFRGKPTKGLLLKDDGAGES